MSGKAIELIPIDFITPQAVSGLDRISLRALWKALGVQRQFQAWIGQFLPRLTRNLDYGVLGKTRPGGLETESADYWITVDTAKFITFVGRRKEASRVRRYLADCEQKLRAYRETAGAELPPWLSDGCFQKAGDDLKHAVEIMGMAAAAVRDCLAFQATCRQLQESMQAKDQLIADLKAQLSCRDWLTIAEVKELITGLANLSNTKVSGLLTSKSRIMGLGPMRVGAESGKLGPRVFHRSVVEELSSDLAAIRSEEVCS